MEKGAGGEGGGYFGVEGEKGAAKDYAWVAVNKYVFPNETCTDDICADAGFSAVTSESRKKSLTWKTRFRTWNRNLVGI